MIAKVRIAPLEQWCEPGRQELARFPQAVHLPGLEIELQPESMQVMPHTGMDEPTRAWIITRESWHRIGRVIGWTYDEDGIDLCRLCEHMLEMD